MISRVKTVITTDIDIDTLSPTHRTDIETDDDLPEEVVAAAVYNACKATMKGLAQRYPRLIPADPADEPTEPEPNKGEWQPGFPCGKCGSTNTIMDDDPTVGARCLDCGACDDDE